MTLSQEQGPETQTLQQKIWFDQHVFDSCTSRQWLNLLNVLSASAITNHQDTTQDIPVYKQFLQTGMLHEIYAAAYLGSHYRSRALFHF